MTRVDAIRKMVEVCGWNIDSLDCMVNSKGIPEIKYEGNVVGWMTEGEGKGLIIFTPFLGATVDLLYETDNFKPATPSFDELKDYVNSLSLRRWFRNR